LFPILNPFIKIEYIPLIDILTVNEQNNNNFASFSNKSYNPKKFNLYVSKIYHLIFSLDFDNTVINNSDIHMKLFKDWTKIVFKLFNLLIFDTYPNNTNNNSYFKFNFQKS